EGKPVGDVRRASARDAAHLVDEKGYREAREAVGHQMLDEPARERHQVIECDRARDDDALAAQRYLPTIGRRRSRASGGIAFGSVRIAKRMECRQGQWRAAVAPPRAARRPPPAARPASRLYAGAPAPPPPTPA